MKNQTICDYCDINRAFSACKICEHDVCKDCHREWKYIICNECTENKIKESMQLYEKKTPTINPTPI